MTRKERWKQKERKSRNKEKGENEMWKKTTDGDLNIMHTILICCTGNFFIYEY